SGSAPVTLTSPRHRWENGDKAILYGVDDRNASEYRAYTVTAVDHATGTLQLEHFRHCDHCDYGKGVLLTSPVDLGRIEAEVIKMASYLRDNISPQLTTYYELSNETWNPQFIQTHWFRAQGRQLFGGDGAKMAGYLAAHCMRVIRDVYGAGY